MYFQRDGAPPHYSRLVREYLHASFPNRWLGRLGPVAWPPRSPDLTPLDYYIWGHMKTLVYETKVDSRAALRARIFAVAEQIRNHPGRIASAIQSLDTCWKLPSKWRWTLWTATLKQILWDKCTEYVSMCTVRYNNWHVIPKFQYACFNCVNSLQQHIQPRVCTCFLQHGIVKLPSHPTQVK